MAGTYVGDGMSPVPAKHASKIRRWGFVEMGKLLPEFWVAPRDGEGDNKQRQGRKVTDLCTWLQCYAIYVAVLTPQEPQVIPDIMAYMGFIINVSQDHEGLGWVRYRLSLQTAGSPYWKQEVVSALPPLFSMNFAARSSAVKRCKLCFSTTHSEHECAQNGDSDPDVGDRLPKPGNGSTGNYKAGSTTVNVVGRASTHSTFRRSLSKVESDRLHLPSKCRHLHVCSTCMCAADATSEGQVQYAPAAAHQVAHIEEVWGVWNLHVFGLRDGAWLVIDLTSPDCSVRSFECIVKS